MTFGSLSDTAMSSIRPPMLAGPIERKRKLLSSGSSDWLITRGGVTGGGVPWPWACGRAANPPMPRAARDSASAAPPVRRIGSNVIDAYPPGCSSGIPRRLRRMRIFRLRILLGVLAERDKWADAERLARRRDNRRGHH